MDAVNWNFFLLMYFSIAVFGQKSIEPLTSFDLNNDTLTINCDSKPLNINTTLVRNVNLKCSLPNIIYSQYLTSLNVNKLDNLNILIDPPGNDTNYTLNDHQFANLDVITLTLDYNFANVTGYEKFLPLSSDFVYNLDRVKDLEIRGFLLVPNIQDPNLESTKCDIESLRIETSNIKEITLGWLKPCKKLTYLFVAKLRQRNGTKEVRRRLLAGLKSLRTLELHECYIEELNDEMEDLVSLRKLNAARNQIHYALTTTTLPALEELDLSHNHIFASSLFTAGVSGLRNLRVISIDHNEVLNLCDQLEYRSTYREEASWNAPLSGQTLVLPLVEIFTLRATITDEFCFHKMYMDSLEYLDVSDSRIKNINFEGFPRTKTRRLEINTSGCPIKDIPAPSFTERHYNQLYHEELRITGLDIKVECECDDLFWMARAVRERRLVLDRVTCTSSEHILLAAEERFNCTRSDCGVCICRKYWADNSTDVECKGKLQQIPSVPGMRRLYAAGNLVENVTAADIPDSLILLDLSKNYISRMSEEDAAALFTNPNRTVRFLGNPIICDCENRGFILQLMDHFDQVEDYTLLSCINDGRLIKVVDPFELCFTSSSRLTPAVFATVGVAMGLLALCTAVYYKYGQAIKVYLYSRGICLFCIREEEIDSDRFYDAFVSFSHKDDDFVKDELLPGLECEPYNYNLCVHYRNWVAGELIPTQINRSVEESKRTIIVLSKHFIESIWGLLEFRTAHLSALREGRPRVIIVILDDILNDDNLDGELKSYLRTNTYVKWGDTWFWDKLRYALPHRPNVANVPQRSSARMTEELSPAVSIDSAIELEHCNSGSLGS